MKQCWKKAGACALRILRLRMMPGVLAVILLCGCAGAADEVETETDRPPLPTGWSVYLPEVEFSTVRDVGGMLLAGGLQGLYRYRPDADDWEKVERADNVPFRMVKAIEADVQGNVWIGHEAGLTCWMGAAEDAVQDLNHMRDLVGTPQHDMEAVNTLWAGRDGTLQAGTYDGVLLLFPDAIRRWLETGETAAFSWRGTAEGLTSPMVNAIYEDSRGAFWYGAYIARGGGVACLYDGKVQQFNHDTGLADDYVTTIAEDAEGGVWVGTGVYTSGGAARFVREGDAYRADRLLMRDDGLAGEKVRYIHADTRGNLWFCSEYDGIAVFDGDGRRILQLTEVQGLPDNEVKRMEETGAGALWFACRRGLLRMAADAEGRP